MLTEGNLIIVNSVYHLINAVNIKDKMLSGQRTDLLVTDITPALREYIPNIIQSGVFDSVIYAVTKDLIKKYTNVSTAEINAGYDNYQKVISLSLNAELKEYKRIFFANFDTFVRMLALKYENSEFVWYEDGFSSYVIDYLRPERAAVNLNPKAIKIKQLVTHALLYEPRLAMRGDNIPNRPLCKILADDKALIKKLNFIFSYKPGAGRDYRFIFLEQSFRAEGIKSNDIELIKECSEAAGDKGFIVKPHPRNADNLAFELGLCRGFYKSYPFELELLNSDSDSVIITVCSNAALTPKLMMDKDTPTIMLYKLFEGKVLWKEDDILFKFLEQFYNLYAGPYYFVPRTIYELRNTIKYLGGIL